MSLIADRRLSRRTFLKAGGALVVMGAVPIELRSALAEAVAAGVPFPPLDPTSLASWLALTFMTASPTAPSRPSARTSLR